MLSELSVEDFTDRNQHLFSGIKHLFNEDAPVNKAGLKNYIVEHEVKNEVGGRSVVDDILSAATGVKSTGMKTGCQYLKRYTTKRKFINLCKDYYEQGKDKNADAEQLLSQAGSDFFELLSDKDDKTETGFIDAIEKTAEEIQNPKEYGMATDLDLDKITLGFKPKQFVVIAGKTSHGKSAFAQNIMLTVAEDSGHVGFVSMEMSRGEIMERIFSMYSGVKLTKITEREMSEKDMAEIISKKEQMKEFEHGFTIIDKGSIDVDRLYATARRLKMQKDIKMLIVDYLQQVTAKGNTREQEVAKVSRTLKRIAMDLDIVVIALSQFNRQASQSHVDRPQLHQLRESGAIEQDANTAILLWNPSVDGKDRFDDSDSEGRWAGQSTENIVELHVAKNRGGKTGTVKVGFDGSVQRFYNLAQKPKSAMDYL
jgi:replicative DNA helicase